MLASDPLYSPLTPYLSALTLVDMKVVASLFLLASSLFQLPRASPLHSATKDKRWFEERDGVNYTVFEHAATGAKMQFVTNSGMIQKMG